MNEKVEKALEIYRKLGYEETDFEKIVSLGAGSKEERVIAKSGLQSGAWTEFRKLSENTYGMVNLLGVDLDKLAIFAIQAGVDARRAVQVLGKNGFPALDAITNRGKTFAGHFVEVCTKSNIRVWEHSASRFGALCVHLVHRLCLPIPKNVSYIKDWAFYAERTLKIKRLTEREEDVFYPDAEIIDTRFKEHIEIGIAVNAPATGPFSKVLVKGVDKGLLDRNEIKQHIFFALDQAARPGDRKEWMGVLEEIGITENEILERAEGLIPLLAFGEAAITEKIAPILIEQIGSDRFGDVFIGALAAKSKKTRQIVLKAALQREKPVDKDAMKEWIDFARNTENGTIRKLLDKLAFKWEISLAEKSKAEEEELEGIWQKTPSLWKVPECDCETVDSEHLTEVAAEISKRKGNVPDIKAEQFLAMANALAWKDKEEAGRCLVGVKNSEMMLTSVLGSWARNQENHTRIDSYMRMEEGKRAKAYSDLITARDFVISKDIGNIPCILSTPSLQDLSIRFSDLVNRLLRYENAGLNSVHEADLQLAFTRLDLSTVTEKDLKRVSRCFFTILLPDGEMLKDEKGKLILVSEVLTDYLKDPYIEPKFSLKEMDIWNMEIEMPKSLRFFPNRFYYNSGDFFSIFPLWGDFSLICVRRDTEVYHGQGLILRQISRRRKVLGKVAAMNFLAVPSYLSDENAEDVMIAIEKAWKRGLLVPEEAEVKSLDWDTGGLSNLVAMASGWEQAARQGVLSVLWYMMDDVIEESVQAPRIIAGTAEIVKLMQKYLMEVCFAIKNGVTDLHSLEVKGLRKLARKSGSSIAVQIAKEVVNEIDAFIHTQSKQTVNIKEEAEKEKKVPLSFDEVWKSLPKAQKRIEDGIRMQIACLECEKSVKPFVFTLRLPEESEYEYKVVIDGWVYALKSEGQVNAIKVPVGSPNTTEYLEMNGKKVWLHLDEDTRKVVVSPHRNWKNQTEGPLTEKASPLSVSMLIIGIALLAQDGEATYYAPALVREWMESGILSQESVRYAMKFLLTMEAVSPAKMVRVLEKDNSLFSLLCVMLPECIKVAGEKTREAGKPPVWVNRVLDICLYYSEILNEATKRGLLSKHDISWQGLDQIAQSKAKSTAKNKAATFLKSVHSDV